MNVSSSLKRPKSSSDLQGFDDERSRFKETLPQKSGSPWLMLFPKDGGCVLYDPKEGKKIHRNLRDFPGSRILANSGNWLLLLDSGSNLVILHVLSEKTIPLPSLESTGSKTSKIKRVGDRVFERVFDDGCIFRELSSDVVRGLLWVDESGTEYVVVWLFDLDPHPYISFCKKGDTQYTDIPLYYPDDHWLHGLSYMVLGRDRLYNSTSRRYVKVLDLSGPQGFFKDITEGGKPFTMLSPRPWDSSLAVTASGVVLLVESNPCQRSCFRVYKYNPDSFLWTIGNEELVSFNTKKTWEVLRQKNAPLPWTAHVWFKGAIPRHAFLFWLTHLDRLPTRARLANWGLQIDTSCCLCGLFLETRDHIFLHCEVSEDLWAIATRRLGYTPFSFHTWDAFSAWLDIKDSTSPRILRRLVAQVIIYAIWRERNNRYHNNISTEVHVLFKALDRQIRDAILAKRNRKQFKSLMRVWLKYD